MTYSDLFHWHFATVTTRVLQLLDIAQMIIGGLKTAPAIKVSAAAHLLRGLMICACWHDLLQLTYMGPEMAHLWHSVSQVWRLYKLEMLLWKRIPGSMIRTHSPYIALQPLGVCVGSGDVCCRCQGAFCLWGNFPRYPSGSKLSCSWLIESWNSHQLW